MEQSEPSNPWAPYSDKLIRQRIENAKREIEILKRVVESCKQELATRGTQRRLVT